MARSSRTESNRHAATRSEKDSFGELRVPRDALYAAQTQRAVQNFDFSELRMPRGFLRALGLVKLAAAQTNAELGHLPGDIAKAIEAAAREVADGQHDPHFPVDVFQTGSGTSSNMNMNEVLATLAARRLGRPVHPNDHVNQGQSSNDIIPTALQVAAELSLHEDLLPALLHLEKTVDRRARELALVAKTGRTHLMDAMPLTLGQELSGWSALVRAARERLLDSSKRLRRLPWGGTAVGTGINADPRFAKLAIARLSKATGLRLEPAPNLFSGLSSAEGAVEMAGQLSTLATALFKIANDLRWMNSGPLAGLGEIELPALQPGSSIMPGKVNPVIPEAVAMIAAQVLGNSATITFAGASGNFQLNVMLPVIAHNLLQSLSLLARAATGLADQAILGFVVRRDHIDVALAKNPILVTALNPIIGYEAAAALAKRAYHDGRPIIEVALESTGLPRQELEKLLDPLVLTRGGIAAQQPKKAARTAKKTAKKSPEKAQRRR